MGPWIPQAASHRVLGGREVPFFPTPICYFTDYSRVPFLFKVEKEQAEILDYPNDKLPPDTHNHDPPFYLIPNGPRPYPGPCEGALRPG